MTAQPALALDRPDLAVEFDVVEPEKPAQSQQVATMTEARAIAPREAPVSVGVSLIQVLQAGLSDPNATPERLNQLFNFYQRVDAAEAKKAFDAALADAQAEFPPLHKNRRVQFKSNKPGGTDTDYRHEDLAEVVTKCGPILAKHGISYKWRTRNPINEPIQVTCILTHKRGHSEENTLVGPRDESGNKNGLQGIASTITYLERYTFKSSIGQASAHDDDGQAAGLPAPEFITEEQETQIREALEATETEIASFAAYFKIDKLSDLKASDFKRAMTALRKKGNR